ncbi:MAG: aromatic amino acid transport family protein [Chlamydia sp.]
MLEKEIDIRSKTIGAALLIAGCCTGAGMLGMPVMSGPYGFLPALLMFCFGYSYMVSTGFLLTSLLIEEKKEGREHIHLLSLTESILGKRGRAITWVLFSFLFYAVLTAYTIGSAKLLQGIIEQLIPNIHPPFPLYAGFSAAMTGLILMRGVRSIDYINRICLLGLIAIYFGIVAISIGSIDIAKIERSFWSFSLFTTLPVIVFSFGYHNLIPTITSYLEFNSKAIRRAILMGTGLSLLIYLLWEVVIFGVVPFSTPSEWFTSIQSGEMITDVLSRSIGHSKLTGMMELFALFAIVTSYITVGMSMADFIRDALQKKKLEQESGRGQLFFVLASLLPPLLIGVLFPNLFLTALNYSGGVIAMILFGILPVVCRIKKPMYQETKLEKIGEACCLVFLFFGAIGIIVIEIGQQFDL